MAVALACFSPDVGGPADPIAPTIIVPPRNTSVVAGTSEVTMECVANARRVAMGMGWGCKPRGEVCHGVEGGVGLRGAGSWHPPAPLPRPLIKLHIIWKKDGVPISSGISDYSRRLTILNPTLGDSGYYECEAVLRSSSVPAVAEGAYLSVLGEALSCMQ